MIFMTFYDNTILITIALQNSLKSGSYDASSFDFFLQIALAI